MNLANVCPTPTRPGVTACGCVRRHKDGKSSLPEYRIRVEMIRRCTDANTINWNVYGGAGVTVCDRWIESFENFYEDMGPRPSAKHSLDRWPDLAGNYEPGNVRWATGKEQGRNRRNVPQYTHDGRTQSVPAWAEELGMTSSTLKSRLRHGWTVAEAFSTPTIRGRGPRSSG